VQDLKEEHQEEVLVEVGKLLVVRQEEDPDPSR
jgi:hypothetical protein